MTSASLRSAILISLGWVSSCASADPDAPPARPPKPGRDVFSQAELCTGVPGSTTGAVACRVADFVLHEDSRESCMADEECVSPEKCQRQIPGAEGACVRPLPPTCVSSADCTAGTTCVSGTGGPGQCVRTLCASCADGTTCSQFWTDGTLAGIACLPSSFVPKPDPPPPSDGTVPPDRRNGVWNHGVYVLDGPARSPCDAGDLFCRGEAGRWACTAPQGPAPFHPCGRPLLVEGVARVARPREGASCARDVGASMALGERFVRIALDEHASIAAFAQTLLYLAALGAPSWLVAETTAALADEVRHAEYAFRLASQMKGVTLSPGPLPEALSLLPDHDLPRRLLADVVVGGCVGETGSVLEAAELEAVAPSGARAFLAMVIDDETRHAVLAFKTARWLCATFPSAREGLAQVVAEALRDVPEALRASLYGPLLESLLAACREDVSVVS